MSKENNSIKNVRGSYSIKNGGLGNNSVKNVYGNYFNKNDALGQEHLREITLVNNFQGKQLQKSQFYQMWPRAAASMTTAKARMSHEDNSYFAHMPPNKGLTRSRCRNPSKDPEEPFSIKSAAPGRILNDLSLRGSFSNQTMKGTPIVTLP